MINSFSIPEPCQEKWDSMSPRGNGRYCGSCQKVVVDFTNKTNEEILEYVRENSGKKMCGTFKNSQLPPPDPFIKHESTIRFLAAVLLVFGMTLFSCNSVDLGDKAAAENYPEATIAGALQLLPPDTLHKVQEAMVETITSTGSGCTTTGITIPEMTEPPEITTGDVVAPVNEIQDTVPLKEEPVIGVLVEVMPQFPGGEKAMMDFITENIIYPQSAKDSAIQGTVYVTFVVKKDGTLDDIRILRGISKDCNEEALRVIRSMPQWKPGMQNGKEVNTRFNLPIKFRMI